MIHTEIGRHSKVIQLFSFLLFPLKVFIKTVEEGAQTTIYCAVQEDIEHLSGLYFSDCTLKESSLKSNDVGIAKKLWEVSEKMTGVNFPL